MMEHVEPAPQHRMLQELVGEWSSECEMPAYGDQPAQTLLGRETITAIGDYWIVGRGEGEMPGVGPVVTQLTLGFDQATGRFTGSWVGSMMGHHWVYDGYVEDGTGRLILESTGPSPAGDGTMGQFRDVVERPDSDTRVMHGEMKQEDGSWSRFMTVTYRRKK